jgi:aminoglycoside phosphotransferase (APT) family kinase protein
LNLLDCNDSLVAIAKKERARITFVENLTLTHPSYRCTLVSSSGKQEEVVIKLWRNLRKHALDEWIQQRLHPNQYPAPTTSRYGVLDNQGYSITPYYSFVQAEEVAKVWSNSEQEQMYHTAGIWLRRLHDQFIFDHAGVLHKNDIGQWESQESWADYLKRDVQRWKQIIYDKEMSNDDLKLWEREYDTFLGQLQTFSVGNSFRYTLCHRDYHARNWLVDEQSRSLALVIDFEHAFAGDPIFDFHRVHAYCLLNERDDLWVAFCQGYGVGPENIEVRSRWHLRSYGLGGIGYALRAGDTKFYNDMVTLLQILKS